MTNLIDYSLIVIAIAFFGFALKESFYLHRRLNCPLTSLDRAEEVLSHISVAVLVISFLWISIIHVILPLPNWPDFIKPFFDGIIQLIDLDVIDENEFVGQFYNFTYYLYLFTWFAYIYLGLYLVTMVFGIAARYFDVVGIMVTFKDDLANPIEYKRIIGETEGFVFLESFEQFREWMAIPKETISRIERVETKSVFERWILRHSDGIQKIPHIGDAKQRAVIILILLLIMLLIVGLSTVVPRDITWILSMIVVIPIIVLVLLHSAYR